MKSPLSITHPTKHASPKVALRSPTPTPPHHIHRGRMRAITARKNLVTSLPRQARNRDDVESEDEEVDRDLSSDIDDVELSCYTLERLPPATHSTAMTAHSTVRIPRALILSCASRTKSPTSTYASTYPSALFTIWDLSLSFVVNVQRIGEVIGRLDGLERFVL